MIRNNEIREQLSQYVFGGANIQSFRDWMVALRLDSYNNLHEEDKAVVRQFEGVYAEFSDNLISEQSLKRLLGSLLGLYAAANAVNAVALFSQKSQTILADLKIPVSGSYSAVSVPAASGSILRNQPKEPDLELLTA